MKNLFAAVLTALLVLSTALLGGLSSPIASAQVLDTPNRLQLDIGQVTPRTVISSSSTMTISGKITNVGDRRLTGVKVRLELGERLATERQLRAGLAEAPLTGATQTKFIDLAETLEPGQSAPISLSVPTGAGGLQISKTGVYPLLINVNGTPEYGAQARLSALSMLLPVLDVPGKSTTPPTAAPAKLSVLWPIADSKPRIIAAPLGGSAILTDDQLATDLAAGGRLDALVASAKSQLSNDRLISSLCFAVDPDLLNTVSAMTREYKVRTPQGEAPGQGTDIAKRWLASLKQLVAGRCVVQLPSADADLTATAKIQDQSDKLLRLAATNEQRIDQILDTPPISGLIWPDTALDAPTRAKLAAVGIKTVITDSARMQFGTKATVGTTISGSSLRAQPSNALLTLALSQKTASSGNTATPANEPNLATQNGLAALTFRAQNPEQTPSPLILAPPHRWNAPTAELTTLLQTIDDFIDRQLVSPAPLTQLLNTPAAGTTAMNYTAQDAAASVPTNVVDGLSDISATLAELRTAMSVDPTTQVEPDDLLSPLRSAILRTNSAAWQGKSGESVSSLNDTRGQLTALLGRITVETPAQPISLASGSSPLPVYISSTLPVSIAVRINLDNNTGLKPAPIPDQTIAANSAFQIYLEAEALRAGRFSVQVSLSTPDGIRLGNSATFELTSSEYGLVTIIITISGAGALLLLSGRRIYRRVKARRNQPADPPQE